MVQRDKNPSAYRVKLQAVGIMQIPFHWGPGNESVFKMLVAANLIWPILFGESHSHQIDALVDHGKKQVHFRYPNRILMSSVEMTALQIASSFQLITELSVVLHS